MKITLAFSSPVQREEHQVSLDNRRTMIALKHTLIPGERKNNLLFILSSNQRLGKNRNLERKLILALKIVSKSIFVTKQIKMYKALA